MPGTARAPHARAEVLAAVPTFFAADGELDREGTVAHHAALAGRVDGVFVAGTTGEFPALDRAERHTLAELALDAYGSERVVVHVGAASTRESVALTRDAVAIGARRIAVLTPYYLPADPSAVARHMAAVVDAAGPARVYGYLFTERSGVVVEPAGFGRLAADVGLAGVKLSGAANERLAEYVAALPAGARLWSGADTTLPAVVRAGGSGIVSGLSAAFPEPFTALADAVAAGDADAERAAQTRADAVLDALAGTVEGIKAALRHLGHGTGTLRMPSPEVPPAALERIARLAGPVPVA
jgi:4-hydroxy-tetrahydrodipicolinate synthase